MRIIDLNGDRVIAIDVDSVELNIPFINGCAACFRGCSFYDRQVNACRKEEETYGKDDNYFINRVKESCAQ